MFNWVTWNHLKSWTSAEALGGELATPVRRISTDTRSLQSGDVFLALQGENFDGHDYVKTAVEKGAVGAILAKKCDLAIPTLRVKDTLRALVAIGKAHRDHFTGPVLAMSGSAGKSSTKDMVATLLGPAAVKSPASFNNLLGVSQTCLLLQEDTAYLVLEMGMNALGELEEMTTLFRPQYGLLTNIGDAHIGKVGGPENLYRAKKELFEGVERAGAKAIALNLDDARVVQAAKEAFPEGVPTVTYSLSQPADVRVTQCHLRSADGKLDLTLEVKGAAFSVELPIYGKHHAQNIAAAVALSLAVGVPLEAIQGRMKSIQPAAHRGEIFDLTEGRTLIDESYNSSPAALKSSLESLGSLQQDRRRLLVVGDMRELEGFSQKLHFEAGAFAGNHLQGSPFCVLGVGQEVAHFIEGVRSVLPQAECHRVGSWLEGLQSVQQLSRPGDILLVKSSRGGQLDQIVSALRSVWAPK